MPSPRSHRIVVIKGDGIGPELVDAALLVLDAARVALGFELEIDLREGGAELYRRTGASLAPDTFEAIKRADAAMKGPVGLPELRLPLFPPSPPAPAKRSLLTYARQVFQQPPGRTATPPLCWTFPDWDAPTWAVQCQQVYHGLAS